MTTDEFRDFMVEIFKLPEERIVPLQGNWWNPQDLAENWIGFKLEAVKPKLKAFKREGDEIVSAHCEVRGRLQFVGAQAEAMAQEFILWPERADVLAALEALGVQTIAEGFGQYTTTDFFQDGGNTVWAYNSTFRMIEEIQVATGQEKITASNMGGSING